MEQSTLPSVELCEANSLLALKLGLFTQRMKNYPETFVFLDFLGY